MMKGMTQELGVNTVSVRKAVKLPGAHSLARTKRFLLIKSQRAYRLVRATKIYTEEYIFMQDGAPCKTSKKTQKWLEKQANF